MKKIIQHVYELILAQTDLLGLAVGVLNDIQPLRHDGFAFLFNQRIPTIRCQLASSRAGSLHSHKRVIEVLVRKEECVWFEREGCGRQKGAIDTELIVKLDEGGASDCGVLKNVMIGQ